MLFSLAGKLFPRKPNVRVSLLQLSARVAHSRSLVLVRAPECDATWRAVRENTAEMAEKRRFPIKLRWLPWLMVTPDCCWVGSHLLCVSFSPSSPC